MLGRAATALLFPRHVTSRGFRRRSLAHATADARSRSSFEPSAALKAALSVLSADEAVSVPLSVS